MISKNQSNLFEQYYSLQADYFDNLDPVLCIAELILQTITIAEYCFDSRKCGMTRLAAVYGKVMEFLTRKKIPHDENFDKLIKVMIQLLYEQNKKYLTAIFKQVFQLDSGCLGKVKHIGV